MIVYLFMRLQQAEQIEVIVPKSEGKTYPTNVSMLPETTTVLRSTSLELSLIP